MAEYIDRQKVIDIINTTCPDFNIPEVNNSWAHKLTVIIRETLVELVKGEPADDVRENIKGEWVHGHEIARAHLVDGSIEIEYEDYSCSSCGFKIDRCVYHLDGSLVYRFCPNCGADMRGKSNENYD